MSRKIPLTASTNGQPVAVGTSLTTIHACVANRVDVLKLDVSNTSAGTRTLTIDVGGEQTTFLIATGFHAHFEMTISGATVLQMSADAAGLEVTGTADRGIPETDHKLPASSSTAGAKIDVGTSSTLIHTSVSGQSDTLRLNVINPELSARILTITVSGGNSISAVLALATSNFFTLTISDGRTLSMSADATGLDVYASVERVRNVA